MISLKTDPKTNDLCLTSLGDIRTCSDQEAIAQDVGSALSIWRGEIPFTPLLGIDYGNFFLKNQSQTNDFLQELRKEALKVSGVQSAQITIEPLGSSRQINGTIQIITDTEEVILASF
ncbi:hypothetical protein FAI40_04670 [Acetobacteraceae bacterium]|nr:hypothetical protein FAI40_04670 [Acetobacteraceae bacterium]